MRTGWLQRAGTFKVEHLPCPHPNQRVDRHVPVKGVLHTIEGSLESGLSVFRRHYAPHFTVGVDRKGRVHIYQHIPLGMMAAALQNDAGGTETNREVYVQVEIAARSNRQPWLPDAKTQVALIALMAELEVPLRRVTTRGRKTALWDRVSGWLHHADVPENDHWDCGAMRTEYLCTRANAMRRDRRTVNAKPKPKPRRVDLKTRPIKRAAKKATPPAEGCLAGAGKAVQPL